MELNREQIIKALKCCGSIGSPNCKECTMVEGRGCAVRLYREALAYINKQETEYNELYELCESYRNELEEVKADTVEKIKLMFAMRFGTYTDDDTVKIKDVFRLMDKFAEETLKNE